MDPELLAYFNLAINEAAIHLASMDGRTIDDAMYFVGDMLNSAFLTAKGKQAFNIFYKSRPLDALPAAPSTADLQ